MCGKIRSLEEKSLPPVRDLHEMGAQVVPDAREEDPVLCFYFHNGPTS